MTSKNIASGFGQVMSSTSGHTLNKERLRQINRKGVEYADNIEREYREHERVAVANGSMRSHPREEGWNSFDE